MGYFNGIRSHDLRDWCRCNVLQIEIWNRKVIDMTGQFKQQLSLFGPEIPRRFKPITSTMPVQCSYQLSYERNVHVKRGLWMKLRSDSTWLDWLLSWEQMNFLGFCPPFSKGSQRMNLINLQILSASCTSIGDWSDPRTSKRELIKCPGSVNKVKT